MPDADTPGKPIANPRDLPPPKALRRKPSPPRDIKTAKERLEIKKANAPSLFVKVQRILSGLTVTAVLLVGVFFIMKSVDNRPKHPQAPWAGKTSPNVFPESIDKQ